MQKNERNIGHWNTGLSKQSRHDDFIQPFLWLSLPALFSLLIIWLTWLIWYWYFTTLIWQGLYCVLGIKLSRILCPHDLWQFSRDCLRNDGKQTRLRCYTNNEIRTDALINYVFVHEHHVGVGVPFKEEGGCRPNCIKVDACNANRGMWNDFMFPTQIAQSQAQKTVVPVWLCKQLKNNHDIHLHGPRLHPMEQS